MQLTCDGSIVLDVPSFLLTKLYHNISGQSGRIYHGVPMAKLIEYFAIKRSVKQGLQSREDIDECHISRCDRHRLAIWQRY